MRYRKLGSSGADVSVVGLGAIAFGDPRHLAKPAESAQVIHAALAEGVNLTEWLPTDAP